MGLFQSSKVHGALDFKGKLVLSIHSTQSKKKELLALQRLTFSKGLFLSLRKKMLLYNPSFDRIKDHMNFKSRFMAEHGMEDLDKQSKAYTDLENEMEAAFEMASNTLLKQIEPKIKFMLETKEFMEDFLELFREVLLTHYCVSEAPDKDMKPHKDQSQRVLYIEKFLEFSTCKKSYIMLSPKTPSAGLPDDNKNRDPSTPSPIGSPKKQKEDPSPAPSASTPGALNKTQVKIMTFVRFVQFLNLLKDFDSIKAKQDRLNLDLSYFRRLQRITTAEYKIHANLDNLTLFFSQHSPLFYFAWTILRTENRNDGKIATSLIKLAHDCFNAIFSELFRESRLLSEKDIGFALVSLICIADRVEIEGVFHKDTQMEIKTILKNLKRYWKNKEEFRLMLEEIREHTEHLEDDTTSKELRKLVFS